MIIWASMMLQTFYGSGSVSHSVMSNSLWPHRVCQAPLSMGFSRQEYWSGRPFSSPGYLPHPGIKLGSLLHCKQILYHLSHAMEFLNFPQFSDVDTSTTNTLKRSKLVFRETCPSHPPSKWQKLRLWTQICWTPKPVFSLHYAVIP